MINSIIQPPEILKNYVRNFWVLEFNIGDCKKKLKLQADYYPMLTVQCNSHSHTQAENGPYLPKIFLGGITTKPANFFIEGAYAHVAVSFYPQALRQIFRVKGSELVNKYYDLSCFCPAELIVRLQEAENYDQRIDLLSEFIISRTRENLSEDAVIRECIFARDHYDTWRLIDIIKKHKLSARQLERKFLESLGISPKTFLRINRFEKSMRLIKNEISNKLSDVAYDLGYSDHSHFTRDFKASAGFSPNKYMTTKKIIEYSGSFLEE